MRIREFQNQFVVEFDNGVSVQARTDGKRFLGLWRVKVGRRDLRTRQWPILPHVVTADGHEVCCYDVRHVEHKDGVVAISLNPYTRLNGRWATCGPDGQVVWTVGRWAQEPVRDRGGSLTLELREVTRLVGTREIRGFSYGYRFRSRRHRRFQIHDRATWELGGTTTGNTLIIPGHPSEPRKTFRSNRDAYTTSLVESGGAQFRAFLGDLPGYTFQNDSSGALLTAFARPFGARSVIQKNAGTNCLIHWHQVCSARNGGRRAQDPPPMEIMYVDMPGNAEHDVANTFEMLRYDLYDRYRAELGLDPARPLAAGVLADVGRARRGQLRRAVDELADAGCAEVIVAHSVACPIEDDAERSGDALDTAGGRIGRISEIAHGRAMETSMLVETNAVSAYDSDQEAAVLRRRQQRLKRLLSALRKTASIDALCVGSAFLGGHESSEPAPELMDIGQTSGLRRAFQEQGYRCAMAARGALGVSTLCVPYALMRRHESLYRDTVMEFPHGDVTAAKDDPHETYFRGYSQRVSYACRLQRMDGRALQMAEWWDEGFAAINRAYTAACEHMESALMLPDGRGVLWDGAPEGPRVLWSYAGFEWPVGAEAHVYDVMAAEAVTPNDGVFVVKPWTVYLVQDADGP